MTTKEIIYYLSGKCLFSKKLNKSGCKIGSTRHILPRMKTYQTLYSDRVPLICYFEIDADCYKVQNKIRLYLSEYLLSGGGRYIYDSEYVTVEKLEEIFRMEGINAVKFYGDELDFTERLSKEEREVISKEDDEIYNSAN